MGKPYKPKDAFFRKAKQAGLRARSAFKVEEIVRRFALIRAGARVLDLGAAPGGFLQVTADLVGERGHVLGVDRVVIQPLARSQVETVVLDVLSPDFGERLDALGKLPFDVVVSDLAPKTTGVRMTDEARSLELARVALHTAVRRLKPGGHFVTKLFMGGDFEAFRDEVRLEFAEVKPVRPEATRSASMELYLVAKGRRSGPSPLQPIRR